MPTVTVYGASDDLIEVEGAIREEFYNPQDGSLAYLAFSDGTVLSVRYGDEGIWRINRVYEAAATYTKQEGTDESSDYSDRVSLEAPSINWVVFGTGWGRVRKA